MHIQQHQPRPPAPSSRQASQVHRKTKRSLAAGPGSQPKRPRALLDRQVPEIVVPSDSEHEHEESDANELIDAHKPEESLGVSTHLRVSLSDQVWGDHPAQPNTAATAGLPNASSSANPRGGQEPSEQPATCDEPDVTGTEACAGRDQSHESNPLETPADAVSSMSTSSDSSSDSDSSSSDSKPAVGADWAANDLEDDGPAQPVPRQVRGSAHSISRSRLPAIDSNDEVRRPSSLFDPSTVFIGPFVIT